MALSRANMLAVLSRSTALLAARSSGVEFRVIVARHRVTRLHAPVDPTTTRLAADGTTGDILRRAAHIADEDVVAADAVLVDLEGARRAVVRVACVCTRMAAVTLSRARARARRRLSATWNETSPRFGSASTRDAFAVDDGARVTVAQMTEIVARVETALELLSADDLAEVTQRVLFATIRTAFRRTAMRLAVEQLPTRRLAKEKWLVFVLLLLKFSLVALPSKLTFLVTRHDDLLVLAAAFERQLDLARSAWRVVAFLRAIMIAALHRVTADLPEQRLAELHFGTFSRRSALEIDTNDAPFTVGDLEDSSLLG